MSPTTVHVVSTPSPASLDGFGEHQFWGAVAEKYLSAQGCSWDELKSGMWVHSPALADKVAAAVLEWGKVNGASSFCHWFQPVCSTGRHGQTGQVQNAMFEFDGLRRPFWELKGKHLLRGETDGSSFPNGGLRATHTAGAYLTIDPKSPIFLRIDCIFIPACFVAYTGMALDEKTPLHRAENAMSTQGARLFKLLGHNIEGMLTNIGLEQELFFVPADAYYKRPDLQMCGRSILGASPALGQEGCTHYMAPINTTKSVFACMQEIQAQCYALGIPLRTRHREVAPNQYEFAPLFGHVFEQTDNNLMVMQIAEEVAPKHGLRAIFHEKPFQGVNGSGKHNNWSISTKCGAQLLNPGDLSRKMKNDHTLFPIVMSAMVSAVDKYGDLMRAAISSPGNDFRLGGMEAPPAVISTYLGQDLTSYLTRFMDGDVAAYAPSSTDINLGVDYLPLVTAPAEDRNRTSPFPYGGHRFEFRAVGSTQNVSLVNTVLASMVAAQFKEIADRVEGGETAVAVAQSLLKDHIKVVFNGNGYAPDWPERAAALNLAVIPSGVDAIKRLTAEKNKTMFHSLGVFNPEEVEARCECLLEHYIGTVETEALCMKDMINKGILPCLKDCGLSDDKVAAIKEELSQATAKLETSVHAVTAMAEGTYAAAAAARTLRLETMRDIRAKVDEVEASVPESVWPYASYRELWFIDQTTG